MTGVEFWDGSEGYSATHVQDALGHRRDGDARHRLERPGADPFVRRKTMGGRSMSVTMRARLSMPAYRASDRCSTRSSRRRRALAGVAVRVAPPGVP